MRRPSPAVSHAFLVEDSRLVSHSRGSSWTRRLGTFLLGVAESIASPMDDFIDHYHRLLGGLRCTSTARAKQAEETNRISRFSIAPCIMTYLDSYPKLLIDPEVASFGLKSYNEFLDTGLHGTCSMTWLAVRTFDNLFNTSSGDVSRRERDRKAVQILLEEGIYHPIQLHDEFPLGILLPILEAIRRCRIDPPQPSERDAYHWPVAAYDLIGRNDLGELASAAPADDEADRPANFSEQDVDGLIALEDYSAMIYPRDNRIKEAARLLRSSRPLLLRVPRPVELSDHDYERTKQDKLALLCRRVIALSIGRGMMTVGTHNLVASEQVCLRQAIHALFAYYVYCPDPLRCKHPLARHSKHRPGR